MDEKLVTNLGKYIYDEENTDLLSEEKVKKSSETALNMLNWVQSMYKFYFVNKRVKPKKEAL